MLTNSDQKWPLLQEHSETKRAASLPSKRSAVTQVFPSSMDTSTRTIPGSCGSWMQAMWPYLSPLRSINLDACFKSHLYLRHSRQNLSPARTPRTQLLHTLHIIWSPWISMDLHISLLQSQSWRLNVIQFHNASSFGSHNSWLDRQVLHGWDLFLGPKHPWSNCRKQILTNAWLWMIFIQLETWETSTEESWAPVYVDAFQILTYSTYLTCGPCPKAVHSQGLMMWLSSLTIGEKPL